VAGGIRQVRRMPDAPSLPELLSRPSSRRRILAGTCVAALVLADDQSELARGGRRLGAVGGRGGADGRLVRRRARPVRRPTCL